MKYENIFDLIDMFKDKDIDSFALKDGGFRLQLKKDLETSPEEKVDGNDSAKVLETEVRAIEQSRIEEEMTQEEKSAVVKNSVNDLLEEVLSKNVGFFHVATPTAQESEGFGEPLKVGAYVKKNQTLCFVSVLGENNEVVSPVNGVIRQANFAEGAFVQFNEVLFIIEKVGE